jgi:hypothetical protein
MTSAQEDARAVNVCMERMRAFAKEQAREKDQPPGPQ